ncbi:hypothetical protein [Pararhizobium sp. PWRC1-1]|uniref:hypothetical protein n=1 Tax=Pararhizobium sp. PWRC1-1 TaxID=2804566 RepID=UPI003CE99B58
MADDLKNLLTALYDAGAEDVPASEIEWRRDQMPMLLRALEMGYVRYSERAGARHFYLTKSGYSAIGIEPLGYSPIGPVIRWLRGLFR